MYKIKFTEQELNRFNVIENESVRKSLMSVYMYLLKLNAKKNDQLAEVGLSYKKDAHKIGISYRDFLKAYNRSHAKISIKTLKSRIDKLIELGLLVAEKVKNSFVYSFHRFTVNKKVNEKVNIPEETNPVVNSKIEPDVEERKYLNSKTILKDIDSNSSGTTVDNFDFEKYISAQDKVTNWEYVSNILNKMFTTMKVRSKWIKGQVIDKLFKNYTNITKKHCVVYIYTAITNARKQYYSNYNKYIRQNETTEKVTPSTFNSFPQRDYEEAYKTLGGIKGLERALLGWDNI